MVVQLEEAEQLEVAVLLEEVELLAGAELLERVKRIVEEEMRTLEVCPGCHQEH